MKETKWRNFIDKHNLRWCLDGDRTIISKTISRKWPHDHMYFYGGDLLGVAIRRDTKRQFTGKRAKLEELGCELRQECESEGNFVIKIDEPALRVAKFLKLIKRPGNPCAFEKVT